MELMLFLWKKHMKTNPFRYSCFNQFSPISLPSPFLSVLYSSSYTLLLRCASLYISSLNSTVEVFAVLNLTPQEIYVGKIWVIIDDWRKSYSLKQNLSWNEYRSSLLLNAGKARFLSYASSFHVCSVIDCSDVG